MLASMESVKDNTLSTVDLILRISGVTRDTPRLHEVQTELYRILEGQVPSRLQVYFAHSITQHRDGEPSYFPAVAGYLSRTGSIACFRPKLFFNGDDHPCLENPNLLVYADLHIVRMCGMLVLDLTEGLSFGATVETTYAKAIGVPIVLICTESQKVSAWAKALSSHQIILPDGRPNVAVVATELMKFVNQHAL